MALPKNLVICCLYLVCLGPVSAHRFLVSSIGSGHEDRTYFTGSAKLVEEAHDVHELTGLTREPEPDMVINISNTDNIKPISFADDNSEFIEPPINPDYASEKAHIKPTTKPRLSISNDKAHVEPRSLTVGDSEFIDPPTDPDSNINKAPGKPTMKLFLSISNGEARVEPKSFAVGDSESIKSPTNPDSTTNKAHMNPTTKPVLSISRDEAHSKSTSSAHEPNTNRHDDVGSNRPVSFGKSNRTGFVDTKDGSDGPFLPSPDCCYLENKAQNRPSSGPTKVELVKRTVTDGP